MFGLLLSLRFNACHNISTSPKSLMSYYYVLRTIKYFKLFKLYYSSWNPSFFYSWIGVPVSDWTIACVVVIAKTCQTLRAEFHPNYFCTAFNVIWRQKYRCFCNWISNLIEVSIKIILIGNINKKSFSEENEYWIGTFFLYNLNY